MELEKRLGKEDYIHPSTQSTSDAAYVNDAMAIVRHVSRKLHKMFGVFMINGLFERILGMSSGSFQTGFEFDAYIKCSIKD